LTIRPASLAHRIERVTADCDTEEDQLRATLGLQSGLDEDERGFCEHLGLLVLAAISDRGNAAL
jgi:hypothetical protein